MAKYRYSLICPPLSGLKTREVKGEQGAEVNAFVNFIHSILAKLKSTFLPFAMLKALYDRAFHGNAIREIHSVRSKFLLGVDVVGLSWVGE